ncbi:type II glyceraldehyde-3-phosphate dehydrogenase [Manganibacter manganicus]|uniref:Glyceraldehyde-3-phosphate dehydrogenase n=1 Tax=Manganibacter manganicus TaxID=1873176 RepID=A0A1V8RJQ1_9HYPH|nr:type II glyceraldehyde-3-phosphate dehydrogenase [Pseudaminobacter manganicus]OQM73440.1 glyceraldehyde-3-phosphate dehydrogenase [Pseudaminobacter manganicus]
MNQNTPVRVAINGYGVIGKRVADAVFCQDDMVVAGVADVATDWRLRLLESKGFALYGATPEHTIAMGEAGLPVVGTLDELLAQSDIVVDCTPKRVAAQNIETYRTRSIKFIVQGGEKHDATGHSFVAESSFESAIGRMATRVVSCNTTSIVRTLGALKRAGLLKRARGTLLRRATDPWESHEGGIMNTLIPEPHIPSHQGPDAQSVDPDLDVVTMAVKVPQTLAHLHYWTVDLTRNATKEEVLDAFRASSRIAFVRTSDGITALNTVKELMADLGRPHDNLYEVALWEDMLKVENGELFYAYMVDNQAIVIPDTIDAIRAITGLSNDAQSSISRTNASLGVGTFLS